MEFLYSGAGHKHEEQLNAELSLGHYPSCSVIPNDMLSNIFSEASVLSIQQKKRETKMIVLHNDSAQKATGVVLSFNINADTIGLYQIAFVTPDVNNCFEKISSSAALPYQGTFQSITAEGTIELPDLYADDYLGIWITRTYDYTSDDLKRKDKKYWMNQLELHNEHQEANPDDDEIWSELIPCPNLQDELDLVLNYELE